MDRLDLPEEFRRRIDEHEKKLAAVEFYILVWGSGEGNEEYYNKRCAIRDHLADANRFGPQAVFMSEDEAFRGMVEQHGLEVAEALQVKAVDAVVVLDTSIGPHTEISKYGDIMMGKTIVFAPEEHKNSPGYAAVAFNALKVEGYTPEQYEDCTEIRRKGNAYCQALRFMKAKSENKI